MDIESQLENLLTEGGKVLATKYTISGVAMPPAVDADSFTTWRTKVLATLDAFPKGTVDRYIKEVETRNSDYYSGAVAIQATVQGIKDSIADGTIDIELQKEHTSFTDLDKVKLLCFRFHKVARSLRNRHAGRDSLIISDEYDVQDLFGSLLKIFFDDVRREEYVPSYAGGASRTDFLLPDAGIVVEIKKTRDSMKDSDLGDQLIIDLERYRAHPQCSYIVCFVYDPDELLNNPEGVMGDLNRIHENEALVVIEP